jgi:hypothetical protein
MKMLIGIRKTKIRFGKNIMKFRIGIHENHDWESNMKITIGSNT